MARRCPADRYRDLVHTARAAIPTLNLTTDLIVGFPGETDAEFAESLAFVEEIGFGHMHVFTYSPREGTAAARMRGQLPNAVKRERSKRIKTLAAAMKAERLAQPVGTTRSVLWEQPVSAEGEQVRWLGYTANYLRTEAVLPAGVRLENRIIDTRITAVLDGERLLGAPA